MADREWKKGDEVLYCKDDLESEKTSTTRKGIIVDLERDDNLNPYYVIRLDNDGSERHTIAKYLKHPIKEDKEKQIIISNDDTPTKPSSETITQVVETTKSQADIPSNNNSNDNELVDQTANILDTNSAERSQSFTDKTTEAKKNVMNHHPSNIMSRPLSNGIPSPLQETNVSPPPLSPPPLYLDSSSETPSINESSLTNNILTQRTPQNDSNNENSDSQPWKVGDDVLYSNDDDFKLTREATVVRIDDDSIFGKFYVIKFKDDETQRIALPKRLHPLGTSPTTNEDNDWVTREKFLKHHFPTEQKFPKNNEANNAHIETKGPPPAAFALNSSNNQIRNTSGSISPMTRQMMKSALVAHQKNKMQLRREKEIIEMNKRSTNRERIQAAMKNLGQPVQEPKNMTKTASVSSMASELSSDMVQRFAVFQLDDDGDSSGDEQSEITAPIRNSHKSSSPMEIHSRPTIGQSKRPSSFRLFKNRSFLKNKAATTRDTQSECEVGGRRYKRTFSEPDMVGSDNDLEDPLPMATEIIDSLDGQRPTRRLSMPTIVKDIPNRRAYFPSFKSQKDKHSHVYPMSPNEGLPIAIASNVNVSEMTSLGGSQENRSLLIQMSPEKKGESRHRFIIAILVVMFAISIAFVAILAVLQVRQNTLSNDFTNNGDASPIDNGKAMNPKIQSESYIQAFWGIDLSPLDSNQITIWQTIMEDYASDFLYDSEKELVSTKCVINFQVHESSVSWNRNRHRKKKKKKKEENLPATRQRNLALRAMNEVHTSNSTEYTFIKVDFTLTFSTVSNDIDLDDYPTIFLERINSDNVKKYILMKLQGRLQLAVEDVEDIYLRNENGSEVFLFTAPTLKPTSRPSQSLSTSPSLSPSVSPSTNPTSANSLSPSTTPSGQPSESPTPSPTNRPTETPYCCSFDVFGHCLIPC